MADRYWVLGSGTWDASDTTHWAATSGGVGGASVPGATDNVFFDLNSGLAHRTVTLSAVANVHDFTSAVGATYVFDQTGTYIKFTGSLVLEVGMQQVNDQTEFMSYGCTTAETVDFGGNQGGVAFLFIEACTGSITLVSDLYITKDLFQDSGTLDLNGYSWRSNVFEVDAYENAPYSTPTVYLRDSEITTKFFDLYSDSTGPGYSPIFYAGTSNIVLRNLSGLSQSPNMVVFDLGPSNAPVDGTAFNYVWYDTSTLVPDQTSLVFGSNIFNELRVSVGHNIAFQEGSTQTVDTFSVAGVAGTLITVRSCNSSGGSSTATHTLAKAGGGRVECDYLNLQHSVATPANRWFAGVNSTNNQGIATAGSGWLFTPPFSNASRNSASFSNASRNAATFANTFRNNASFSNASRNSASFSNTPRSAAPAWTEQEK